MKPGAASIQSIAKDTNNEYGRGAHPSLVPHEPLLYLMSAGLCTCHQIIRRVKGMTAVSNYFFFFFPFAGRRLLLLRYWLRCRTGKSPGSMYDSEIRRYSRELSV